MKRLLISMDSSEFSVLKALPTTEESFNAEGTENTEKAKVLSSREVEKRRKLGYRELFRACVWR